jgi:hypothetical protein
MSGFWSSKLNINAQQIEEKLNGSVVIPQEYGLCSKCQYFIYRKTKLMDVETICEAYVENRVRFKTQPRSYDPITECSQFRQRGQMDLEQMQRIAFIIDVKKRQIGFSGTEQVDVTITEPKEDKDE